jgi:hypothetical protein
MAELAARDEGTEIWAVHRGRKGSGEFFLYELFRDGPAFELHQRNEALNTLGRQLAELADDLVVTSGRLVGGLRPRADGIGHRSAPRPTAARACRLPACRRLPRLTAADMIALTVNSPI